jgi:drug/metabolite transporter superfamily protein YnfA
MGLIFIAMAIASIVAGFAVIYWVRRSEEEHLTAGSGCLAIALIVGGVLMMVWALYWS